MANSTTVTELSGINTAQTSGDNSPAAAMEIPDHVVEADTTKPARTTAAARRENASTSASRGILPRRE